jgi:hypothetical protein
VPLSSIPITNVSEAHLQALIDDKVGEGGRRIEFKREIGTNDEKKREFLADVTSFSNSAGGDILVGVAEKDGIADSLDGIASSAVDSEVLRLENAIRDGVEPRIPGLSIRPIEIRGGERSVLVIRIPRSWASPHMVTFRGHSRFYARNSAGKYALDVSELRAAFAASETVRERLTNLRVERISRIATNDAPIRLFDAPKTVLHLIPLSALDPATRYDVAELTDYSSPHFSPLTGSAWNLRINFDGALAFAPGDERGDQSYTLAFRTGVIEGVEAFMLRRRDQTGGQHLIPSTLFEQTLIKALDRYMRLAADIGAPLPYVVALSLLGVRGLEMAVNTRFFRDGLVPIDRDNLILPEVYVEDLEQPGDLILRPLFDAIWNSVGWKGSPNYNEAGRWVPPGD